jgi:hypothetical protein
MYKKMNNNFSTYYFEIILMLTNKVLLHLAENTGVYVFLSKVDQEKHFAVSA